MAEIVRGERRGQRWTRLTHGVHARGAVDDDDRLRGIGLVLPDDAVFTHLTAAALRGWWLPRPMPRPVFAAIADGGRHPQRRGLAVIRQRVPPQAEVVRGFRVATAPETLLAAARDLAVLDLVPVVDSALRQRCCSLAELGAVAAPGRRGAARLRAAALLADARSESAWESMMRVLHGAAGIQVEPQHILTDDRGRFLARADLWLVGTRRLHEYDGEVHRDRSVHRSDLDRDRRLLDSDYQRYGYTAAEVLAGGGILASVDQALGRRWQPERLTRWRQLVSDSSWARSP